MGHGCAMEIQRLNGLFAASVVYSFHRQQTKSHCSSIKGYTKCIQVYTNGQGRFFHPDIHNNSASLLPDILPSI